MVGVMGFSWVMWGMVGKSFWSFWWGTTEMHVDMCRGTAGKFTNM